MKAQQIQDLVGYLRNDPEYKLDETRMATILAILLAYEKGVQSKFLGVDDLTVSIDYLGATLERLPAPFHQTVAYVLSNIEFCHKQAQDTLREFYYFNKTRDYTPITNEDNLK